LKKILLFLIFNYFLYLLINKNLNNIQYELKLRNYKHILLLFSFVYLFLVISQISKVLTGKKIFYINY